MFIFLFRSHKHPYSLTEVSFFPFSLFFLDPPKIDADAVSKFSEAVVVRSGENAIFKLPFSGKVPIRVQWLKDEAELLEGSGVRIESSSSQSRLLLNKCQRKDTGEVKIKLKNEFSTNEATSKLIVLGMSLVKQLCRMWLRQLKSNKCFL